MPREAVSTTRPRPSPTSRSPMPRSSSPLDPWANAPLKQQSRITIWRRARQSSSWSNSQCDSTPEEASRFLRVSRAAKYSRRRASIEAVAGQVDQQHVVGAPVGEEVLDCEPDLLGLLVDHRCHREAADVGVGQQVAQLCGVTRRGTQPPQGRVDVVRDGDDQCQATPFGGGARQRSRCQAIRTSPTFSPGLVGSRPPSTVEREARRRHRRLGTARSH